MKKRIVVKEKDASIKMTKKKAVEKQEIKCFVCGKTIIEDPFYIKRSVKGEPDEYEKYICEKCMFSKLQEKFKEE